MISKAVCLLLSTLFAAAFAQLKNRHTPSLLYYIPTHPRTDNSTFANTDYVQDYHIQIDWDYVFWGNSTLLGSITHEMKVVADTDFVTLDVWDLNIINVTSVAPGSAKTATKNGHRVPLGDTELTWNVQTKDPGSG